MGCKLLTLSILCLIATISVRYSSSTKQCIRIDSHGCMCNFTDGSGMVDLRSLGNKDNTPRFKDINGTDGYMYSYNPCYAFIEGGCNNAAVCLLRNGSQKQIGDVGTATFQYVDDQNDILAFYTIRQFGTASIVRLTCDLKAVEPVFKAFGELTVGFYSSQLSSVCACPGLCTKDGPLDINT
ncbi:uncharacterized protein LOC123530697 [Mercenaria mercenaria]|uniref:uncharacterized protein LOC123530697 n=1 Tax=Mercenaria mercenaria TaxID=6596 RepID=UPI00234EB499|nr:uncharacterized protein LOC123530697 [Mercenaria mercenaria]